MSSRMKLCSICLDNYRQPTFLDCHHTFCKECIRSLASYSYVIKCPLCKKVMKLPSVLDELTPNFYLNDQDSPCTLEWSKKLMELEFRWGKKHHKHKFSGVTFKLELSQRKIEQWGEVLAIDIQLPTARKYFVKACNIEYNITLVNQKKASVSTNQKGQVQLHNKRVIVPLIRFKDAMDVPKGFIVRKVTYCQVFQLEVNLKVSDVEYVDFNITL